MPFATLSDAKLYYETSGSGPALLLVPGLGSTARAWEKVVPLLDTHFTTIRADHRGVGRSEALRDAESISDYSADLVELLDHLQIETAHVMGLSLGGIIAQRFAAEHPDRIDKLVLISTTHKFDPYIREIVGLLGVTLRGMNGSDRFTRTIKLLGRGPAYFDADPAGFDASVVNAQALKIPREQVAHQLKCVWADDGRGEAFAARIACPTLVLAGQYDAIIPHYYSKRTSDCIKGSRFMMVPNAGHDPLADCAETLIPVIRRFFETGEGGTLGEVKANVA